MKQTKPDSPPWKLLYPGHLVKGPHYRHDRPEGIYDWLIILTLQGAGRIYWPHGECVARRGDVILIEPNFPHGYQTDPQTQEWDLLWAHFEPSSDWRQWMRWPLTGPGVRLIQLADEQVFDRVHHHLAQTLQLYHTYMSHRMELARSSLHSALLWCDQVNPLAQSSRFDPRLREILDHIATHLDRPLSITQLAERCGLSVSRFAHLFRETMGISPQKFIEHRRIEQACHLLEHTSLSLSEIAEATGFDNPYYFSARFKHLKKSSPTLYRTTRQRKPRR